jgi:predicted Holliday junction resolvase-like endonuclease
MIPLNDAIIVALITAAAAIVGNLIISRKSTQEMGHKLEINQREMAHKLETQQAVTDTKSEELTREVRAHNNFAQRMPVVEEQIKSIKGTVNELQHYHME